MIKKNWPFLNALKGRGLNLTRLAGLAGVSRAHLSAVIANQPGRGAQVRRKVAVLLTDTERALLGWTECRMPACDRGTAMERLPLDRMIGALVRSGFFFCERCERVTDRVGEDPHWRCGFCGAPSVRWIAGIGWKA